MSKLFDMKLLGGILLIVGTSIGGALLVLPVTNAPAGFLYSSLTMIAVWLLTMFTALLLLEVNLWLPTNSNLISMAKFSLGLPGKIFAWLTYLLLLYSLLSAYISGGANVLAGLTARLHFTLPTAVNALLFTLLFGIIVYRGIKAIDHVNRALIAFKMGAYLLLVVFILPHVDLQLLQGGESRYIIGAVMYIIVSFGFAIIIPSLRGYYNDNIAQLRFVVIFGTMVPLLCYVLWTFAIMGVVPRTGDNSLMAMLTQDYGPVALVSSISSSLQTTGITNIAQFFISICVLTAFLGVSLCLVDFLADGLNINKQTRKGLWIYTLTFIPPLLIAIVEPNTFRVALRYAGLICVLLLILLPIVMAWSGRYFKKVQGPFQAPGGKMLLSIATIAALALFAIAIQQTFAPSF